MPSKRRFFVLHNPPDNLGLLCNIFTAQRR